jgi:tight adherence protein B
MRKRHLAYVAAIVAAAFWSAAPAAAESPLRLVEAGRAGFPERAFVLSLPARKRLSAADVQVRENGVLVRDVKIVAAGSAATDDVGVVLLVDASASMRGKAIRDAVEAARAFADRRPPNQQLGIVAFNRRASVLVPLTTNDDEIERALARPPLLASGTRIYDAVDSAVALFERSDVSVGTIIVLSDGADTGSAVSAAEAATAARAARVRVFTVGIRSRQFTSAPLRTLGERAGGGYAEATSTAELARIYGELGTRLANEYVVRYRSGATPNRKVRVAVRVTDVPGVAVSGYTTPHVARRASGPFRESALSRVWRSPLTMLVVALMTAGLLGLALLAVIRPRGRTLRSRMSEFVSIRTAPLEADGKGMMASRVLVGAERSLEATRWWARFKETLELAQIRMPAVQIALWTGVATLFVMWLLALVGGSPLFAAFGLGVPLAVRSLIYRKLERRRKLFAEQLPDNLQVLASALRAGHSFVGALSVVVDDAAEPSRTEFKRIVADEQLGVPLEDAIRGVVRRMDNHDFEQVALVASLQRRTGGSMAEVLERVTDTIRERFELRRMVQTLTAQGRMSRWIVSALPVALLGVITALNPAYTAPLFTTTGGRLALLFAALMVVAGSYVIKRIVDIKV